MSADAMPVIRRIGQSRLILIAFVLVAVMLAGISAIRFQAPELLGQDKLLTDFDAFHIAGTLAGRGDVADAYTASAMMDAQAERSPTAKLMPWTYPPPFTLFVDALADLPVGVAYVLFILASFGFYLVVLHRIAGTWLPGVLLFVMPAVLVNLRVGQNGFLVAALIGAFLLAWRDRKMAAGVPLGLMIIKPHLAAGIGLLALFGRRWSVLAIAALVALGALGLSTLAYGFGVWPAFLGAVAEAGAFLAGGHYSLFRMGSVYAALRSWGLPADWAMTGHLVGALAALGLLAWVSLAKFAFRHRAALICALSLFVSPYSYDYDLAILGVGLAFIAPDLAARASPRALGALLALGWVTCGYGVMIEALLPADQSGASSLAASIAPAIIAPLLIGLCLVTLRLARPREDRDKSLCAPAANPF
ncbi:glycosyltransferase family 87 protein [Erythrobacter sanguineus]|nr:glycosyltransferase family 87 protein [Erythrobacter sanguineus]